jgi:hypothetical protein
MNAHDNDRAILYHYGELNPRETEEFERHLGGCARCRQELSVLRALGEAHVHAQPPQRALDAVRAAVLPARRSFVRNFNFSLRPALAFAALALAVMATYKIVTVKKQPVPLPATAEVAMKWDDGFETKLASVTDETKSLDTSLAHGRSDSFDYSASHAEDDKITTDYYSGRL